MLEACYYFIVPKTIEDNKQIYCTYKNKPWPCPTLQEPVYFNAEGLQHLLYNRKRPRSRAQQLYRAKLIPVLPTVIEKATSAYKRIESVRELIFTWKLEYTIKIGGRWQVVRVILIKRGNSRITFLSAMRVRYTPNPTKKT
jgi:hypothetical protein